MEEWSVLLCSGFYPCASAQGKSTSGLPSLKSLYGVGEPHTWGIVERHVTTLGFKFLSSLIEAKK